MHHHGYMDDPDSLAAYQAAVKRAFYALLAKLLAENPGMRSEDLASFWSRTLASTGRSEAARYST